MDKQFLLLALLQVLAVEAQLSRDDKVLLLKQHNEARASVDNVGNMRYMVSNTMKMANQCIILLSNGM